MNARERCPRGSGGHAWGRYGDAELVGGKGRLRRKRTCSACGKHQWFTVPYKEYPRWGWPAKQTQAEERAQALSNAQAEADARWPEVERLLKSEARCAAVAERAARKSVDQAIQAGRLLKDVRDLFPARGGFRKWAEEHGLSGTNTSRYLLLGELANAQSGHYATIAEAVEAGRKAKRVRAVAEAERRVRLAGGAMSLEPKRGFVGGQRKLDAAREELHKLRAPCAVRPEPAPVLRRRGLPDEPVPEFEALLAQVERFLEALGWRALLTVHRGAR